MESKEWNNNWFECDGGEIIPFSTLPVVTEGEDSVVIDLLKGFTRLNSARAGKVQLDAYKRYLNGDHNEAVEKRDCTTCKFEDKGSFDVCLSCNECNGFDLWAAK